jgi:hypothetical protein
MELAATGALFLGRNRQGRQRAFPAPIPEEGWHLRHAPEPGSDQPPDDGRTTDSSTFAGNNGKLDTVRVNIGGPAATSSRSDSADHRAGNTDRRVYPRAVRDASGAHADEKSALKAIDDLKAALKTAKIMPTTKAKK